MFEENNDVAVNVLGYDDGTENCPRPKNMIPKPTLYPLRISKREKPRDTIYLLLISDGEQQHYILINHLSRLLNNGRKHLLHYCNHCLRGYALIITFLINNFMVIVVEHINFS